MNTHIELPPLPSPLGIVDPEGTEGMMQYTAKDLQDYAKAYARAAIEADRKRRGEPVDLDRYDAGLLGGQDGMPAYVWHDIIRAELDRAYDFYMVQLDRAAPQPADHSGAPTLHSTDSGAQNENQAPQPAEPVKVPSDMDILELWSGDPTHSRPVMGKNKVIAFAHALLARYTTPQPAEPDSAKCAECGAEMIHVRPGKWQHPDCPQSPRAAEPVTCFKCGHPQHRGDCVNVAPQPAEPVKVPSDDLAHEIWAAAQTAPGEGIEDAVERVAALLARYGRGTP